jgi:hypothetical protein
MVTILTIFESYASPHLSPDEQATAEPLYLYSTEGEPEMGLMLCASGCRPCREFRAAMPVRPVAPPPSSVSTDDTDTTDDILED